MEAAHNDPSMECAAQQTKKTALAASSAVFAFSMSMLSSLVNTWAAEGVTESYMNENVHATMRLPRAHKQPAGSLRLRRKGKVPALHA